MKNDDKIDLNGILYNDSFHPIWRGKQIMQLAGKVSLGCPARLAEEYDKEIPEVGLTFMEVTLIVEYWTREVLKNHINCFLWGEFDTDWRLVRRAIKRMEAVAKLVGRDVVKYAIDKTIIEYSQTGDPRHWQVYWTGTREEKDQVIEEVQRELQQQMEAEEKAEEANSRSHLEK